MPEQEQSGQQRGTSFAHVKMPAAFVHPYTFTSKAGKTFDKAIVDIPKGVRVNGIDIGGFKTDVFMNSRMKQQMLAGEQVTLGFKGSEPVAIFKGRSGEEGYERFEVSPYDLTHALKTNNEEFKAAKAAEREARGDLAAEEKAARDGADALVGGGIEGPEHENERQ